MLSIYEARKMGINACINKLGRDFVLKYKDSCVSAYGGSEDGVYCFIGVDDNPDCYDNDADVLILDSASKFPYRVSCNVSLTDKTITFIECVLPSHVS